MSALVGYESSDEEDAVQERPAKIAKLDHTAPKEPAESMESSSKDKKVVLTRIAIPEPTAPLPTAPSSHLEHNDIQGPSLGPTVPAAPPNASGDDATGSPLSPYTTERQTLRELTMPTIPDFSIPDSPPPPERNSEAAATLSATTKKLQKFLDLKRQGTHFNDRLSNTVSLRNPGLLPKLMEFAGISEEESYASTLTGEGIGVRTKWAEECYAENLVKRNEKAKKKRGDKLDFVPQKAGREKNS